MKHTDFEMMRVQELLVLRASEGLCDLDAVELEKLGSSNVDSFDLAAAMVELSVEHNEEMPDELAEKILNTAFSTGGRPVTNSMDSATAPALPSVAAVLTAKALPAVTSSPVVSIAEARQKSTSKRASAWMYSGWTVAAAAASVALWTSTKRDVVSAPPASDSSTAAAISSIGSKSDVVTLALSPASPVQLQGSVQWSPSAQAGVLSVSGLPQNSPSKNRYQLWIFDADRDARFPVDAGLFDASAEATKFSFAPRVAVASASRFMITLEAASGAVVSDRVNTLAMTK